MLLLLLLLLERGQVVMLQGVVCFPEAATQKTDLPKHQ
jgi:hypothetical protein